MTPRSIFREGRRSCGEANGHGVSATPENHYGTKSVAAAMTVSLTPALSQWARETETVMAGLGLFGNAVRL
jgi:hypothetical protein